VHPLVVIADLRRGCLTSLERYLSENQGIPDREVALELRKLIIGSQHRSPYRLMVVDHPAKPKSKEGRPKKANSKLSNRDRELVAKFESQRKVEGKAYRAKEVLAERGVGSRSAVDRARRRAKQNEVSDRPHAGEQFDREKLTASLIKRRRMALEKHRREKG
jgi:hypothetical protein